MSDPPPRGLVDCSTNDYLGLSRHPRLVEAAAEAAHAHGVGAGASRVVSGTSELHQRVEERFAAFKGAARGLIAPTGYMANLAVMTALPSPGDLLLLDRLNHASLIDAARLAGASTSGLGEAPVAVRTYRHLDVEHARQRATRHLEERPGATVWIVTDAVFSMDGDLADLPALGSLRDELVGAGACAALVLDEAHATGVLGPGGAGLDAWRGHIADVIISTASKALGSLGGMITGAPEVIEAVEHFARAYIYTTGATPVQVAAIDAALDALRDEPERRERLQAMIRRVRGALREAGWDAALAERDPTPIIPLVVGDSEKALELSAWLRERGVFAPAIRPPTVAKGAARVRLSLRSDLSDEEVGRIIEAVGRP